MALTKLTADVENVQALDDLPNDNDGLSAAELKAVFDKAGVDIKAFINDIFIPELETAIDAAARGVSQATTLSGSVLSDGTVTSSKLATGDNAGAVSSNNIRQYAVLEKHLSNALQTKLATYGTNITNLQNGLQMQGTKHDQDIANVNARVDNLSSVVDGKQAQHIKRTVTLASGVISWSVACEGVTVNNAVIVSPYSASWAEYTNKGIHLTGQYANSLTFASTSETSSDVIVNVIILP